mgnify:CR=1 FL=1
MDASPTNLQQCGEVGGIQVEHLSLSLSCSMELRNELIWKFRTCCNWSVRG